ncbi:hybrid sensor histidine kinase/response regulator [Stutzerimonas xanthomarina]|uniref:hybrid sensor histidine kinase/response regulator n=1 Tax=Stutzerimonas xanthomarina TaxID=271420 RepID=UPI0029A13BF9|nr:response regulator [Stutzerimonas xanthomarina]MDX2355208.1 response regulator [Stutzerimonas xanthomarina]
MINSGQPMFVAWGPQRILLYNDPYSTMLGARHPRAFARPFFETWPEVRESVGGLMDRVFAGEPIHMEDLTLTLYRNGYAEETHFTFSYTPVPDDLGEIIGLFCACTETTGQVSAERQQAVDAKRERDRLFEMSRDLFGVASFDGKLLSINPAWSRQLERPMEELLSRPFSEIIHPDDLAVTSDVIASLQAGQAVHQFYVRLLKADGTPISFAWSAVPETNTNDGTFYTVGRDITDDLRREETIRQGQKMEALGQLTGGLAHDFNNLLQAAQGSFDLLSRNPNDPERVARLARNGLQVTERGAKLTAQLLAFSRAQKLELRPIPIASLLSGMTEILRSSVGPLVSVTIELSSQDLCVSSDPTQLEMALLNLAFNSRDAMPEGGDIIISVSERMFVEDPDLLPGTYVEICVSDTGTGMPAAIAAKAFEPFYTTKGVGRGTGLGLSQVYAMAKQAGGAARIEQHKPQGTKVVLSLPSVEAAIKSEATYDEPPPFEQFDAKVLVVDDDPDVRLFLATSLETLGFDVVVAEDALRGLAVVENVQFDLVLVDFAMPGMNGAQMAEVIRQTHPGLPIIFSSGYSETEAIERVLGESAVLLRKPFGVSDLQAVLNAALGR